MTSKQFFGNWKYKDINSYIYNDKDELVYENHTTTFANVNPILKDEIQDAIDDYKKNWVNKGEPYKVRIFTTPNYMECIYHIPTKKKEFIKY